MKFLRAWWLQILGAVVVLGFLGWLVVAGGGGKVSQVRATPTPSPTLTAQEQIEQVVKDFVAAYDLSAKTEDPSAAQAFCVPQSAAEFDASVESDLAKQTGEAAVIDARTWGASSWVAQPAGPESAAADASFVETFRIVVANSGTQVQGAQTKTFHWHSTMKLIGSIWKISSFSIQ